MSSFSADGSVTVTIALQPFILSVVAVTLLALCIGLLIGHRLGPARVVFVPERPRGARKYWMQPDGSITTQQSEDGNDVLLNRAGERAPRDVIFRSPGA